MGGDGGGLEFSFRSLSVLAYANGFTLWNYRVGAGELDGVLAPGFFSRSDRVLAPGDVILVTCPGGLVVLSVLEWLGGVRRIL